MEKDIYTALRAVKTHGEQQAGGLGLTIRVLADGLRDQGFSRETVEAVERNLGGIAEAYKAYHTEYEKACREGRHTQKGLRELRKTLKQGVENAISEFEDGTLSSIKDAVKSLEARFLRGEREPAGWKSDTDRLAQNIDSLLSFFREKEIRDGLRDKDETEIVAAYIAATDNNSDPLLASAIENAPAARPLIKDPAVLQEGRIRRARLSMPDKAAEYDLFTALSKTYDFVINTVRQEVGPRDPIDDLMKQGAPENAPDPVDSLSAEAKGAA